MSEQGADAALQTYRTRSGKEMSINDATKIVGCWRALTETRKGKLTDDPEITTVNPRDRIHKHYRRIKESCEPLERGY